MLAIDQVELSDFIFLFEALPLWFRKAKLYGGFNNAKILENGRYFYLLLQLAVPLRKDPIFGALLAAQAPAATRPDQLEVEDESCKKALIDLLELLNIRCFAYLVVKLCGQLIRKQALEPTATFL